MGLNAKQVLAELEKVFPRIFALRWEGSGRFCLAASGQEFLFYSLPRSQEDENLLLKDRTGQGGTAGMQASAQTEMPHQVHIWEDQWTLRRAAVLSRLAALLGVCRRVHGRETTVQRVNAPTGYNFLEAHHLLVPLKGKYRFGLYYKNELVSLAVFSGARQMEGRGQGHRSFELMRFCHSSGLLVNGGLSKLLNAFAAAFHPGDIMTYVDLDWSLGMSFLKSGFVPAGSTPMQVFWIKPDEGIRYYPQRLPAALRPAVPERMHQLGYYRIYNRGSLKFIRYYEPEREYDEQAQGR